MPPTGEPVFPPITNLTAVALSPDERWLAVAGTNCIVQVLAADTGRIVAQVIGHTDRVDMIGFSPDSTRMLTASRGQTVRQWEIATGEPIGSPLRHPQGVVRSVFDADASRIATATAAEDEGTAIQFQTWDTATGAPLGKAIPGIEFCSVLSFDRSGRYLVTADGGGWPGFGMPILMRRQCPPLPSVALHAELLSARMALWWRSAAKPGACGFSIWRPVTRPSHHSTMQAPRSRFGSTVMAVSC